MPTASNRQPTPILTHVVQQHFEELADGAARRLQSTSHWRLWALARADQRLTAHLDGLIIAGDSGWRLSRAALASPSAGVVFAATVLALKSGREHFNALIAIAEAVPQTRGGLLSALGWTDRTHLRGLIAPLLVSDNPFQRLVGVAACALHRIDAGLVSRELLRDPNPMVRARALRTAGELGLVEVLSTCIAALEDDDSDCNFWAAWSSVLLGDRERALDLLMRTALSSGSLRTRAFKLAIQAMSNGAAHSLLERLALMPERHRSLIEGTGLSGDPTYIPWLIRQMSAAASARVAGEAFTLLTGADLERQQLWNNRPDGFESGPNDDPEDPDVDMDPDDGLPWPDVGRIEKWWAANSERFPKGTRYFMGAPVTREHCVEVLKNGSQRQRILAANYLCLLDPGTPLFNTSAPAWRQQRVLAAM